jgi:phosphoserine phosphatase
MSKSIVAFDVDLTLLNADRTPKYGVIQIAKWFIQNGNSLVIIWSGGGKDYAEQVGRKLGFGDTVSYHAKTKETAEFLSPDITFDDEPIELSKVNVLVGDEQFGNE